MYSCKGSSGQQPITPITTRPISGSGIRPIAITPTRPSPIAGNTGPVLFPVNPPSGNNFQGQRPGYGSYQGQRPSGYGYGQGQGPSGYGGNYYPSGPGAYPSGPYYPYFDVEGKEGIKEVSENVIEE